MLSPEVAAKVRGTPVEGFPRRTRRGRWDFSDIADGTVYLLRRGEHFDVQVDAVAAAARRWAKAHGLRLVTASLFDEQSPARDKIGLYLRFQDP